MGRHVCSRLPYSLLLGLGLLWICSLSFTSAEQMHWRYPGLSGSWFDPHNWRGATTGDPRIPGPFDDVVLSEWSPVYGNNYIVTIEGPLVSVNSLEIGGVNCLECSSPQSSYIYNYSSSAPASSYWEPFTVASQNTYCAVSLEVVAPAQVSVTNQFLLNGGGLLGLISDPSDLSLRASVSAGTWTISGAIYGAGDLYGAVTFSGGDLYVARSFQGATLPSNVSERYGTMTFHTAVSLSSGFLNIPVNYDLGLYSVLDVRGNFTPPTQVVVVPTGTLNNTPYPVISYFNYTGSSSRVLIAYTGSSVLLPPIRQVCSGILPFVIYSYTCSIISPFDFATLMGTSANSTTPCPPENTCPGFSEVCNGLGQCLNPPHCGCQTGWGGLACDEPVCDSTDCSGNGVCFAPLPLGSQLPYCICNDGWGGADCSTPLCPNDCTSPTNGFCNSDTIGAPACACYPGFMLGPALDCSVDMSTTCPGQLLNCSGHGTCPSSSCGCDSNWEGLDCSIPICAAACSQHGACVSAGGNATQCRCYTGWTGPTCAVPTCENGCSSNGYCSTDLFPPRCICNEPLLFPTYLPVSPANASAQGWSGPACATPFPPDVCSASNCVANGGTCGSYPISDITCTIGSCPPGRSGWDCSEYICANTGYPECYGNGVCTLIGGEPQCICNPGYVLSGGTCQYASCEVNGCSGRGTCSISSSPPRCLCSQYYYGDDCSIVSFPLVLDLGSLTVQIGFQGESPIVSIVPKGTDQGLIVQPWLIQEIVSNGSSVRDVPIPLDGYVIQNTIDADNNQFFIFTYTNISDTASIIMQYTLFATPSNVTSAGLSFLVDPSTLKFEITIEDWPFLEQDHTLLLHLSLHISLGVSSITTTTSPSSTTFILSSSNVLTTTINAIGQAIADDNNTVPIGVSLNQTSSNGTLDLQLLLPHFNSSMHYDPDFGVTFEGGGDGTSTNLLPLLALIALVIPIGCFVVGAILLAWVVTRKRRARASMSKHLMLAAEEVGGL